MKRGLFVLLILLESILVLNSIGIKTTNANHVPLYIPIKWDRMHLDRMWANSFPNDSKRTLVKEIHAHDAGCYSNTCDTNNTTGSWARWYISEGYPHIGINDSTITPAYSYNDTTNTCGNNDFRVTFHFEDIVGADPRFTEAGTAKLCPFNKPVYTCQSPEINGTSSSSPITNTPGQDIPTCTPPEVPVITGWKKYIGSGAVRFASNVDFWYGGIGSMPPKDRPDFVSTVTHEMGHIFNLNHYPPDVNGYSTDVNCNGPSSTDMGESNPSRATMCVPLYPGTRRQVTPEKDEKDTFKNFYSSKL